MFFDGMRKTSWCGGVRTWNDGGMMRNDGVKITRARLKNIWGELREEDV